MTAHRRLDAAALSLVGVYEISKILSASIDLGGAMRSVLNLMSSYLEMRRGVVLVAGPDDALDAIGGGRPDAPAPRTMAREILASAMPVVIESVGDDPELLDYVQEAGALDGERVAVIGVPIKAAGRTFGVLAIARVWSDPGDVSFGEDLRFLTMIANLVGQTVKLHNGGGGAEGAPRPAPSAVLRPTFRQALQSIGAETVVGASKPMQEVFAQIHLVAPTRSTVILRGESGTGKEVIARALHILSPRKDKPFVKVNCAALPDTLLESELFGHEKGAFTGATHERKGRFELADGGTLFLDEIGDVSPAFQAKLLRVLQEREFERVGGTRTLKVDVRIVCATNRNLEEAVARGDFRADLYYRINVVPVFVPALRERKEDIPQLAEHFLARFNEENDRQLRFAEDALRVLKSCAFPGNVRELENCVQRVATLTRGEVIQDLNLPCQTSQCHCRVLTPTPAFTQFEPSLPGGAFPPPPITSSSGAAGLADSADEGAPDWSNLDHIEDLHALPERERLVRVMDKCGWVQAKAARMLGLTPRQMGYALRKHSIEIKRL